MDMIKTLVWPQNLSEFCTTQPHSFGKNSSARRLLPAAWLERWPQVCRVKITFIVLPTNRFVYTTTNPIKCLVKWIPLRIRVRSRNTQPHLKSFDHHYGHLWSPHCRLWSLLFDTAIVISHTSPKRRSGSVLWSPLWSRMVTSLSVMVTAMVIAVFIPHK